MLTYFFNVTTAIFISYAPTRLMWCEHPDVNPKDSLKAVITFVLSLNGTWRFRGLQTMKRDFESLLVFLFNCFHHIWLDFLHVLVCRLYCQSEIVQSEKHHSFQGEDTVVFTSALYVKRYKLCRHFSVLWPALSKSSQQCISSSHNIC